jgi:alpha-tubulin suppressor-like RCC1 family protein
MLKNIIINARKTEPAPPVYFTELWGTGLQQNLVGDNTTINRSSPVQIGTDTDWSYVHSGPNSYAIKTSGSLWAWGSNQYGEMGDNTSGLSDNRSSPVQVGTLTNWKKIVGYNKAIALKTDGTIWVWGRNGGALGLGDIVDRSSPVQMGTDTDWYDITDIPASLAIKTNGTLWGWGSTGNYLGFSLPANEFNEIVTANRSFSSFSSDNVHALAISQDGTLWGWGNQQSVGLLGLNGGDNFRSSAVQVGSDTNWSKITAGWNHCAGIKTDGTLWTWGRNTNGQLGLLDVVTRSSPVQVGTRSDWTQVSAGRSHTMALRSDGTFWSFGGNANGVLGVFGVARSSPVQVGTRSDWTQISSAEAHSAAIRSDGTLWTWGSNNLGRTGRNTTFSSLSSPVQVGTRSDWTQVSINQANSAAIRSDGTLWTWGQNGVGQLGDGTTINRSSPVQVGTRSDWTQVSTRSSTIAVVSDGTLWVWGLNSSGQLGLLDSISRSSPTQVGTLSNWVSGSGANVVNMVMDNSGKIYTAGLFTLNQIGVLGRSPTDNTERSSPVQIGTETNWAKFFHNCIQKTDSTVWTLRSKPTQVQGSTDWKILAFSDDVDTISTIKIGIKNDGTIWSWGNNSYGILGQNTSSAVTLSSPTQIGTDNNWHYISRIGNGSIQAIKTDGTLWGWGQPYTFGPGDLIERSSPTQVGTLSNWVSASNGYLIGHFIKRYT